MSRTLRYFSTEDPYSIDAEYGRISDAVADELFGVKGGDGDGSYVDRDGVLRWKDPPPSQDGLPSGAAETFVALLRRDSLDFGAGAGTWVPDITGSSSGVQISRGLSPMADPLAIQAGRIHGVSVVRLSDPQDATSVLYVFTSSPTLVRGISRMGGWRTDQIFTPE